MLKDGELVILDGHPLDNDWRFVIMDSKSGGLRANAWQFGWWLPQSRMIWDKEVWIVMVKTKERLIIAKTGWNTCARCRSGICCTGLLNEYGEWLQLLVINNSANLT